LLRSFAPLIAVVIFFNNMNKWLKRIFIGFSILLLGIISLICFAIIQNWHQNNYKSHIQTLKLPDKNIQFILLTDIAGFGDRAWYVYQLPIGAKITKTMKMGHNQEGVLFWNYSETGIHYDNPNLKVLKDKFLVFSRGELYYSLYNIKTQKVMVNDVSPWASYLTDSESKNSFNKSSNYEETMKKLERWVHQNLHAKIEKALKNAI